MANEFIARNGVISKSNIVVSGSLTALSSIVAQTLVVQTITSSISSITGSTNFGTLSSNTHTFTGSILTSGSVSINGASATSELNIYNTTQPKITFQNSGSNRAYIYADSSYLYLNSVTSNPISLQIDSSEKMRILANGNVGIGITSPISLLQLQSGDLTLSKNAIGSATEVANITFRNDYMGAYNWAQIKGVNGANHDYSNLTFSTTHGFNSMSEKARITSDGYLRLATNGIQFNNDTSDVNSLDDYEEGTFTPTVNLLGTVSYNNRVGYYTKIGNVVYYSIYVVCSSNDSTQDATAYSISGLPFTSKASDSALNPIAPVCSEQMYKTSNLIGIYFQVSYNNSAGTFLQNSWNNELANKTYYSSARRNYYSGGTQYINITGFYYTA